jgi:hypothetical protein
VSGNDAGGVTMLWDILLGMLAALVLLVLLSVVVTGLTDFYRSLLERRLGGTMRRPDLIPVLARFAAVATVALCLGLALSLHLFGAG